MTRSVVTAALLVALAVVPGGAAGDTGTVYTEAVASSRADNQARYDYNVDFYYNIGCVIDPTDPSLVPGFYGAGWGTFDPGVAWVNAVDNAAFGATCASPSFAGDFTLAVAYHFQYYQGRGVWVDLLPEGGAPFTCSVSATAEGERRVAHVQVPGTKGCAFQQAYPDGGAHLSRPHRLSVSLTVDSGRDYDAPHITGWSLPWPMEPRVR